MNTETFRELCLSLPEAEEQMHFHLPSFRVRGKIFATLHLDKNCAMVKLSPEQQREFCELTPVAFFPVQGSWGEKGATYMQLEKVKQRDAESAVKTAWRNVTPKKMHALLK